MTDIAVSTTSYQTEKRSWLLSPHGTGPNENPSITLDVSAFTAATHYPNGYIPSGTAVSELPSGLYGPQDAASALHHYLLFGSLRVPNPADTTKDVAGAGVAHGYVRLSKLPATLTAAAQAKFPLIHFTN